MFRSLIFRLAGMVAACRANCGIAACLPLWSARCSTLLLAAPCPWTRGIMPVSDWAGECCFAAVRAQWLEQLHVKGSSWGQQLEGKSAQEKGEISRRFLEQCGAKQTSRGVSLCSLPTSTYCSAAPAAKSVAQRALQCRFLYVGSRVQNIFQLVLVLAL